MLIDEILTRRLLAFLARRYLSRRAPVPPSYDKQFVRDYLETLDWDKTPPGPRLPADVIERDRGQVPGSARAPDRARARRLTPGRPRRKKKPAPLVGVVMGSQSDWDVMREACNVLAEFGVAL